MNPNSEYNRGYWDGRDSLAERNHELELAVADLKDRVEALTEQRDDARRASNTYYGFCMTLQDEKRALQIRAEAAELQLDGLLNTLAEALQNR